jgi:hypothetical protein
MAELATIATIASIGSAVVGAAGTIAAGKASKATAEYQSEAMKRKAAEEMAGGQRSAIERREMGEKENSRQIALAAASGAGTANPTVLDLVEEAAGRGEYMAQGEMFGAKSRAAGLKDQAKATLWGGEQAEQASYLSAFGDLLGGAGKAAGYMDATDPRKKIGPWSTTVSYG